MSIARARVPVARSSSVRVASSIFAVALVAFALEVVYARQAGADEAAPTTADTSEVGVTEHLGDPLPLDVPFVDHTGRSIKLRDVFDDNRPAVVVFGYHTCPMLCSLVQNATADALRGIGWVVGRDFNVIVISIDPSDTPSVAARKRQQIIARYRAGRALPTVDARDGGWHYLTGDAASIRAAADAAGFHFRYDPKLKQFSHPAVVMLATPRGHLARYLYGLEFRPKDVEYGLLEAAANRSVTTLDRVLLYCMQFDSARGRYRLVIAHVMQIGGAATATALAAMLGVLWVADRRRQRRTSLKEGAES